MLWGGQRTFPVPSSACVSSGGTEASCSRGHARIMIPTAPPNLRSGEGELCVPEFAGVGGLRQWQQEGDAQDSLETRIPLLSLPKRAWT